MTTDLSRRDLLAASALLLGSWPLQGRAQAWRNLPGLRSPMPSFDGAVDWLQSTALTPQELRGKVVLVQFWTYTCINWLRTFPYVAAWAAKYRDSGLVVVGVHTPEFSFEQETANVRDAVARLGVQYPVAVDSRQAVWRAFRNAAWPALYLVDATGAVRWRHDGEGEYEAAEGWIRTLLAEAGAKQAPGGVVKVDARGPHVAAEWATLRSPETYAGYQKAERFRSPGGMEEDRARHYDAAPRLGLNDWAAMGPWRFGAEAARSEGAAARIAYRFQARDVNLVMGVGRQRSPVPFRLLVDGRPPGPSHGSDVDPGGRGVLAEQRLYQLVRQDGKVRERLVEIEFLAPGAEVYAFTFG